MLFYTIATASMLQNARMQARTIKQYNSKNKVCLLLCDEMTAQSAAEVEPFDMIISSTDFSVGGEISTAYWHFLHTPEALCAALKPWGAITFLQLTGENKVVYLAPNITVSDEILKLENQLAHYDIIIAPHPMLSADDFDSRESPYDSHFFAVNHSSHHGSQFLQRWAHAAETLWQSRSNIDSFAYNRLIDGTPALYPSAHILQDASFVLSNTIESLTNAPCSYGFYDNGEPVSDADRIAARSDSTLMEQFSMTDPFSTREADCMYRSLRAQENAQDVGLYWNEYQEVVNSTSYRVGKKLVNLAGKLLPTALFNKLRGKSSAAPALPETSAFSEDTIEIVPLTIPSYETPIVSAVLLNCSDFENTYKTIHGIVSNHAEFAYEILLSGIMSDEDRIRLHDTVSGLRFLEHTALSEVISAAQGKYILLLDEYLRIPAGYLNNIAEYMDTFDCGIVQTKVCFSDRLVYEAGGVLTQNGQRIPYGFGISQDLGCVRYYKEIDCASLRGTVISRNALMDIGGLDSCFTELYALADASFAMRKLGHKTMFVPELQIIDARVFDITLQPFAPGKQAHLFREKWKDTLLEENIADSSELFYGRDRSKGRKTVFAVDDRIPCYDLSAGDRNTYQYYETMADMGYNMKIVGDDYVRQEPYATKLERQGIEIVAADGRGEVEYREFLRDYGKFVDTAYLNRPNNLAKYTSEVKKYNPDARIVYCCHDLHFLRELREHEVNGNRKEAERVRNYAKEEIGRMDMADVIFDVSAYEKSILDPQLKHAKVEVNPIFIYREFPEFKENFDQRKDLLFVGSFKHPGNLDGVDWLCKEIMPVVIKAMPDVKLHLVGAHPTPEIKALANEHIIVHGFLSDEDLAEMYRKCRLSVVPLRFGAGVKGKVLEAMYHGLPIVSTSIGTEGIVDIEECIENTDGAKEFAEKIIKLYPQIDILTEMGRTNWQYVQDHLGVEPAKELFRRSL